MLNQRGIKQILEPMSHSDRVAWLSSKMSPHEIGPYLDYLFAKRPASETKGSEPAITGNLFEIAQARFKKAIAEGKIQLSDPEKPPELKKLELDRLHTQFLLGADSLYDDASFYNPGIIKTRTVNWLRYEFHGSGKTAGAIFGPKGCGKTFGLIAYLNYAANILQGMDGRVYSKTGYVRAYDLCEMLCDKDSSKLKSLEKKEILVIDDIGTEGENWKGRDFKSYLNHIIDKRYIFRQKILIASNFRKQEFCERYGDRIESRLAQVGMFLQTDEPDLRHNEAIKNPG
jgi:hypothetical protein